MPGEELQIQLSKKSMIVFDGAVLEVFGMSDAVRVHIQGLERVEVKEGRTGGFLITNRFGSDYGVSFDKERLPELQEFAARINEAAERASAG